ncbi:amidase signature domain-containing protein [Podospora aff. communis PSN243]|uniref:Amidase signature domain-containing protein n=1 Tax=Podospora aff. communis PSN243 TaxID=3040156 RepID=A0AAV9GYA4_9PEZI|nr:amidase signature domain-containing protein [Podospora aff. communis PSN243]
MSSSSALLKHCVVQFADLGLVYHVKQPPVLRLPGGAPSSIEPAVVVGLPPVLTDVKSFLVDKLRTFETADDVYQPIFSERGTFIFQYDKEPSYLEKAPEAVAELFDSSRSRLVFHSVTDTKPLPEGPYFWSGNAVYQTWRLYADDLRAFVLATIPSSVLSSKYAFEPLLATSSYGNELAVAVPSRLYTPRSPELPLNGLRVSVKDNVHLEGVKTSMGCRAYVDYYGPQPETAAYVKKLIDMGTPPNQTIDYFAPWNPRADGYLRPAGSSSGAGASIAGYAWCDVAIGTDTTGSGREPARAAGVQGLRLSGKSLPMDGVVPSSEEFDSLAILTRSLDELREFTSLSFDGTLSTKLPNKILYPTDWMPYKMPEQQQLNEKFLAAMEDVLGVKHTKINLASMWKESPPAAAEGKSIAEYLENTGFWLMYYDNYHTFDDFREGYKRKFGKEVYVSPSQRWKWDLGAKVTPGQRAQGLRECEVYREWVQQHVLTRDSEGNGEAVIILPLGNAKPDYRDQESGPPSIVKSFEPKYFGSVLGLPQIVTPVGQLAYESRISHRREFVPVIATIAGARGKLNGFQTFSLVPRLPFKRQRCYAG